MLDFTSASYLGSEFSNIDFCLKTSLTIGKPAFLKEPLLNRWVGNQIAQMQGLESGVIAPSSLHLFWDLFGILSENYVVFIEENTYPIGQWGAIHADSRNLSVIRFQAENLRKLQELIMQNCHSKQKPLIVCDAIDIDSGKISPLKEYLQLVEPFKGNLLIDDTQTFGVFGENSNKNHVFGYFGGGILKFLKIDSSKILTITSLSKAFGVPVSILAGTEKLIKSFKKNSLIRVHTSPVSAVHAMATAHIIKNNQLVGENLRQKLWNNIQHFQRNLAKLDCVKIANGIFPVQKISLVYPNSTLLIYQKLLENNIECLLLAPPNKHQQPSLAFCIRADHSFADLNTLTTILMKILKKGSIRFSKNIFNNQNIFSHERRNQRK